MQEIKYGGPAPVQLLASLPDEIEAIFRNLRGRLCFGSGEIVALSVIDTDFQQSTVIFDG